MVWPFSSPAARPAVGLALQGGGAHGAYTWGVLDALLVQHFPLAEGTANPNELPDEPSVG